MNKKQSGKKIKKDAIKRMIKKRIIKICLFIFLVALIYTNAPNYRLNYVKDKTNLIINNRNVTLQSQKRDIFIDEKGTIYLSEEDMKNYFDKYLFYDENNKQIITTSDTKEASFKLNEKEISINGIRSSILSPLIISEDIRYLPISEMTDVYNIEIKYIKDTNTVIIESLDRKLVKADVSKNIKVKTTTKFFSKTVDKLERGEKIVVASIDKGWARIRTENGRVGYVKEKYLANKIDVREDFKKDFGKIQGKVNMFWDYYSEYAKAPNRNGTNFVGVNVVSPTFFELKDMDVNIKDKVGESGKQYINWAKENNYQVWPTISNNTVSVNKEITSTIMNDYNLRKKLIEKIVDLTIIYDLDGINIDFENMKKEDKDMFSRFIIELEPRLKEYGKILSVDVTAPEGSDTWSLCYDRNIIADVSDYIVFMAYDQNTKTIGTVSGYDWIEESINKFIENEKVPAEKIILALPFYTRVWTQDSEQKVSSDVVNMKSVDELLRKNSVTEKQWLDDEKQNYVQYEKNGQTYKMWIEDEESLKAKISLVKKYNLAGVSFWEKDRETDTVWEMIKQELDNM